MNLEFSIDKQIIKFANRADSKVVEKSKNYLHAKFTFSEEWNGLAKTAIFTPAKEKPYVVLLENDSCKIPWEAIKYPYFKVSVFGGDLITVNETTV